MKTLHAILKKQAEGNRRYWLLALVIVLQCVAIYHVAFINWRGPGDFGGNNNYLPAVMIGIGRGFCDVDVKTLEATPALNSFINYETMRLNPADIPDNMRTIEANEGHRIYRYLLYTVGALWRIFGVSWNVIRVLCVAVLFLAALLVYGISRLLLPPLWSLLVAHAFVWNIAVLATMSSLRDFSKAFFVLFAVYMLGTLIRRLPSRRQYLRAAISIGIVLGVGMGFRRDMQAILPLSLVVMATCRLQPMRHALLWRVWGMFLLVVIFIAVSFPILVDFYPQRWVNAHDAIMGFASVSDESLGVLQPASYEKHRMQSDVYTTIKAWTALRYGFLTDYNPQFASNPEIHDSSSILYPYILHSIVTFPADFLSRAYAAVLRSCTGVHWTLLTPFQVFESLGLIFVALGLLMIAATQPYQAWQVLLMLSLFCGYTSIQYGMRHAFHTTFIPHLFGCFVLYHLIQAAKNRNAFPRQMSVGKIGRYTLRLCLWALITALLFIVPLKVAQHIQHEQVMRLLGNYKQAERVTVGHVLIPDWDGRTRIRPTVSMVCRECKEPAFYNMVDVSVYVAWFDEAASPLEVDVLYDWRETAVDLSGPALSYTRDGKGTGKIAFYFPVYEIVHGDDWNMFSGIRVPNEQARYFRGFEKLINIESLGYFVNLTVPENDEAFVAAQKIALPWPRVPRFQTSYRYGQIHLDKETQAIQRALASDNAEEGIRLCQEMLKKYSGSLQFTVLLAQAYFQDERHEEAWKIVDEILVAYPEQAQVYRRLDLLFADIGGIEGRFQRWRHIVGTHPHSPCALFYYENAVIDLAESALTIADTERYRRLMDEQPEFERLALQGDAWLKKNGTLSERAAFWEDFAEQHQTGAQPFVRLGVALEELDDCDGAAVAYARAYSNDPENPEAVIRHVTSAQSGLGVQAVLPVVEGAARTRPEKKMLAMDCLARAGDHAAKCGDYATAGSYYQQAARYAEELQLSMRVTELLFKHPQMLEKQGKAEEALKELKRLLPIYPEYGPGILLSEMLLSAERRIEFWRAIVRENPICVRPWIRLGAALVEANYFEEAALAYTNALGNSLGDPEVAIRYLTAPHVPLAETERVRGVMSILSKYPDYIPLASRCFEQGAEFHIAQGAYEQAARFYLYATQCMPANVWARFAAAKAFLEGDAPEDAYDIISKVLQQEDDLPDDLERRLWITLFLMNKEHEGFTLGSYVKKHHPGQAETVQQELMVEAEEQLHRNKIGDAARIARMAVDIMPTKGAAWLFAGRIEESRNNLKVLKSLYQQALENVPDTESIAPFIDEQLVRLYSTDERREMWETLVEKFPDNEEMHLRYALSLTDANRNQESLYHFEFARENLLLHAEIQLRYGGALLRTDRIADGLKVLFDAVQQEPAWLPLAVEMSVQAGDRLLLEKRYAEAEKVYGHILEYVPGDLLITLKLGEIFLEAGANDKALESFREFMLHVPDTTEYKQMVQHLDLLVQAVTSPADRVAFWKDVVERLPGQALSLERLTLALVDAGDNAGALAVCDNALQQGTHSAEVHLMHGSLLCVQGRFDEGIMLLEEALGGIQVLEREMIDMVLMAAQAAVERRQFSQARKMIAVVQSARSEDMRHQVRTGELLMSLEAYDEALEYFRSVLLTAPESPRTADNIDDLYDKLGSPDKRVREWEHLLEKHPESPTVQEHLRRAQQTRGEAGNPTAQ